MSSTVEEVKRYGKKAWMTHFAAVIAEIEDLSIVTPNNVRYNRVNNPAFIFYSADYEKVERQREVLQEETLELPMVQEELSEKEKTKLVGKLIDTSVKTSEGSSSSKLIGT
ncbi:unnamed protein product [Mucor hiemalis]